VLASAYNTEIGNGWDAWGRFAVNWFTARVIMGPGRSYALVGEAVDAPMGDYSYGISCTSCKCRETALPCVNSRASIVWHLLQFMGIQC